MADGLTMEVVEKGREAVQTQIDHAIGLMQQIEVCEEPGNLPGLYGTLQRAHIHAYHALDRSLVGEFSTDMGVVRAAVEKGIDEGHIFFKPAEEMRFYGIAELFTGGLSLVGRIQAIHGGTGEGPSKNPEEEYIQLGRTREFIVNAGKTYSTIMGGEFHRMDKQFHIGQIGGYAPVTDNHRPEGYNQVVYWFEKGGDTDCVVPLLKFAVHPDIVKRDRGWFGTGYKGTDYAKRVAHAISCIRTRQGGEVDNLLEQVSEQLFEARSTPGYEDSNGILEYARASHGPSRVYKMIGRVERVVKGSGFVGDN